MASSPPLYPSFRVATFCTKYKVGYCTGTSLDASAHRPPVTGSTRKSRILIQMSSARARRTLLRTLPEPHFWTPGPGWNGLLYSRARLMRSRQRCATGVQRTCRRRKSSAALLTKDGRRCSQAYACDPRARGLSWHARLMLARGR